MSSKSETIPQLSQAEQKQSLLDSIVAHQQEVASRYMPTLTPKQFTEREKLIAELRSMLVEGVDYGVIPGTDKPTLLLPGAQKVCAYFGYVPRYTFDEKIESWTPDKYGEMLFYYSIGCDLEKDSKRVGSGLGSCNSWESKYRYRWVGEDVAARRQDLDSLMRRDGSITEFAFAIDKAETQGQYGKPKEYWDRWMTAITSGEAKHTRRKTSQGKELDAWEMGGTQYRIPNPDIADQINTVLKIAKKRAYIDATLSATGLSQYFTQDLEDLYGPDEHFDASPKQPAHNAPKSGRAVPDELKGMFANLDKNPQHFKEATSILQQELIKRGGKAGTEAYERIVKAFREVVPKGSETMADLKDVLLDLWAEIEKFPEYSEHDVAQEAR